MCGVNLWENWTEPESFVFALESGSCYVTHAGRDLPEHLQLTFNLKSSCFSVPSAGVIGTCHHDNGLEDYCYSG